MKRAAWWLLLLLPAWAAAAQKQADQNRVLMYRYHAADGTTTIGSQLTRQAIYSGYQVLDQSGLVIKTVPPAPPAEQAQRRKALAAKQKAAERAREDEKLERIYGGPDDAERARDRQLQELKLKVGYAQNALKNLKSKRDDEVHDAARIERAGHKVPLSTRRTIDDYNQRIQDAQQSIDEYQKDMDQVRRKFAPVIQRLKQLQG